MLESSESNSSYSDKVQLEREVGILRGARGRFTRGTKPPSAAKWSSNCRKMSDKVLARLTLMVTSGKYSGANQLKACEIILAYGYGKPSQTVDINQQSTNVNIQSFVNAPREMDMSTWLAWVKSEKEKLENQGVKAIELQQCPTVGQSLEEAAFEVAGIPMEVKDVTSVSRETLQPVQEVCQVVETVQPTPSENVPIYMESSIDASARHAKQVRQVSKARQRPTNPTPKRMSLRQRNILDATIDALPPSEAEK